ncbi:MAG: hypothetical protein KAJ53_10505 [Anaerolineales bacterium]|nr:hypothetical protein [Anaerolineales bacterium]
MKVQLAVDSCQWGSSVMVSGVRVGNQDKATGSKTEAFLAVNLHLGTMYDV